MAETRALALSQRLWLQTLSQRRCGLDLSLSILLTIIELLHFYLWQFWWGWSHFRVPGGSEVQTDGCVFSAGSFPVQFRLKMVVIYACLVSGVSCKEDKWAGSEPCMIMRQSLHWKLHLEESAMQSKRAHSQKTNFNTIKCDHQMERWLLRARLCAHPEISPESKSAGSTNSFRWGYKLRSPLCLHMPKDHLHTLRIL